MIKDIMFSEDARTKMLLGATALAQSVKATMGPKGRNVMMERDTEAPKVTKDGVSVAREIHLENKFENLGAQMVKQAAQKTAEIAGDGTTTATVLTEAIFREGVKLMAAGHSPMELKAGIDMAVKAVVQEIKERAQPVQGIEDIRKIGKVSANGDEELGDLIAEAFDAVGRDGVITVEEAQGTETVLHITEGMQLDRGYLSSYLTTDPERGVSEMERPLVLVTDQKFAKAADAIGLLEIAMAEGRPLFIVADDVTQDALHALIVNHLRGSVESVAIKAPHYGDHRAGVLEDIAAMTGAAFITASQGRALSAVSLEDFGTCARLTVSVSETVITASEERAEAIQARVGQLRGALAIAGTELDKDRLTARIARLSGGIAVIRVGASTETEMREKKDRVDDALSATKAAAESGVVAGGGVALVRASEVLKQMLSGLDDKDERRYGVQILYAAVQEPLRQIVTNAGLEAAVVWTHVCEGEADFGYNARTDEYGNMVEMGVIDPAKVVCAALQNAASAATMLLTTECAIVSR